MKMVSHNRGNQPQNATYYDERYAITVQIMYYMIFDI